MNRLIAIFLSISFLFVSCGNRQAKTLLQDVESYIQERPDSALRVLRKVDSLTLNTKALRARYSVLFAMALDKNYIDTTDVSVVMPAVNYYRRHGNPNDKLRAYFYLGNIYMNANMLDKAIVAYSLAEDSCKESNDSVQKGILYMAISYLYNKVHNVDKQLEYARKGFECYHIVGDTTHLYLSYADLALIYHSKQDWHKADSLYSLGFEKLKSDTLVVKNLLLNYAKMKMIQSNPDPEGAISLLKMLASDYHQPLSVVEYGIYAYASDMLGDKATADNIIEQLEDLDDNQKSRALVWLYLTYKNRGDYKKTLEYEIVSEERNDYVLDSLLAVPVSQGLQNHYLALANESRLKSLRVVTTSIVILVFAALLFITLLLHQRVRRMKELENEELMLRLLEDANHVLEQENSELRIKASEKDLERQHAQMSFASIYKDKFTTIGELSRIFLDAKKGEEKKDVIYYRVEQLVASISDDDKLFARFESQINQDLNDIVIHLKEDLGHLDKKDERFICYLIAGLDSRTIAALMNLSISNVYTKKSRLRERIRKIDSPYKNEYLNLI